MQQKEIQFLKSSLLENKSEEEINKIENNYKKKIFQIQQEFAESSISSQMDSGKLLEITKANDPSSMLKKEKETILKVKSKQKKINFFFRKN